MATKHDYSNINTRNKIKLWLGKDIFNKFQKRS